ncbi:DNA pilot protein [Dipodfec virus UOA04_Rod_1038]|nr:DNA pilot protein [Dipodfec virus UOA04_Rod_1038]
MGNFFKGLLNAIPVVGPVIGMGIDAISGAADRNQAAKAAQQANNTNLAIAQQNNMAQMKLAEYQFDKNLQMWNLQNEYNSPSSQMARYRAAGLNPNLAVGNAGNSASTPSYSAPTLQRAEVNPAVRSMPAITAFGQGIKTLLDMQMQLKEIESMEVNNSLRRSNMEYLGARQGFLGSQQNLLDFNLLLQQQLKPYLLRRHALQNDVLTGNINLQKLRANEIMYRVNDLFPLQKRALNALVNQRNTQNRILRYQGDLWSQGINPNDPLWMRQLDHYFGDIIQKLGQGLSKGVNSIMSYFFK